jgi:hypothetical protein
MKPLGKVIRLIAFLLVILGPADAIDKSQRSKPILHGTINVVFANRNGVVVLTDSMITDGNRQLAEPGQKLFRIDDKTVCAFAGFFSGGAGFSELYIQSGGIIQDYAAKLAKQRLSIRMEDKLRTLSFLFQRHLRALSLARWSVGLQTKPELYTVLLTLVGYDIDGVLKVGTIQIDGTYGTPEGNLKDFGVVQAPDDFRYWVIGERAIADEILANPENFPQQAIARYAAALRRDNGRSLQLSDLEALAVEIKDLTSLRSPSVGGPNQLAIFFAGSLQTFQQPPFSSPRSPIDFMIVANNYFEGGLPVKSNVALLVASNAFANAELRLDNTYFLGNRIKNSTLIFDGGLLRFDSSNTLVNCKLVAGPRVNRDSQEFKALVKSFQWKEISGLAPTLPPRRSVRGSSPTDFR